MTQIIAERLAQRAKQLDDDQAKKVLAFIEFVLSQARFEEERCEWHLASE